MKKNLILTCFLSLSSLSICSATSKQELGQNNASIDDVVNCNLQKTPLEKCELYNSYIVTDKDLNRRYKNLIKSLNPISIKSLREQQRLWLKFREKRCEELQLAAQCESLICRGVEHDMCVLELTTKRTKELENFSKDIKSAISHDFSYDSVYPKPIPGD
jgi:uncharacterized protein YecT (DUF1311 family)